MIAPSLKKRELTPEKFVEIDFENDSGLTGLLHSQVIELSDLKKVASGLITLDKKQKSSIPYMIKKVKELLKNETDPNLTKDYENVLKILEDHRDDFCENIPIRHKLEDVLLQTFNNLIGYTCTKDELAELDDDKKKGLTEKNKNALDVIQNIMKEMTKLDDAQEENVNLITDNMKGFIQNETDPILRQYLRDITTYMQDHKKDLWNNAEVRNKFKDLIMIVAKEIINNQDLTSIELVKLDVSKEKALDKTNKELLLYIQGLINRVHKHEAKDMAKPQAITSNINNALNSINNESFGPNLTDNITNPINKVEDIIKERTNEIDNEIKTGKEIKNNLKDTLKKINNNASVLGDKNQEALRHELEDDLLKQSNLLLHGNLDKDDF